MPYVKGVIVEPGVYIDKPTGAVLLILGMDQRFSKPDVDGNFLELIQLVVLDGDDREWREEGVLVMCQEFIFDDYESPDGTCLERVT